MMPQIEKAAHESAPESPGFLPQAFSREPEIKLPEGRELAAPKEIVDLVERFRKQ